MPMPVLRFAPSPNGRLHLGHALSALINERLAQKLKGRLLLRIEDIDRQRCTPELEMRMIEDLDWLGIEFERPHLRQSENFDAYRHALDRLAARGLLYPAFLSRSEIRQAVMAEEARTGRPWPRDPDGAPLLPPIDRLRPESERRALIEAGHPFAWRLDMQAALAEAALPLAFEDLQVSRDGKKSLVEARPDLWGDVLLARRDTPTSYHLSVVVDDAAQGVTHVVRGQDLFPRDRCACAAAAASRPAAACLLPPPAGAGCGRAQAFQKRRGDRARRITRGRRNAGIDSCAFCRDDQFRVRIRFSSVNSRRAAKATAIAKPSSYSVPCGMFQSPS
jgi:glutamyl-Q tRNA(Asp) synthetase